MTEENQTPDAPGPATGNEPPHDPTAYAASPAERRPWRDRVLGYRGVAAVALASVILGGAGGAALGAISNGSDDGRGGMRGPGGNGPGTFGQLPGQNGQNGQSRPQGDGTDRIAPPDQSQDSGADDGTDS